MILFISNNVLVVQLKFVEPVFTTSLNLYIAILKNLGQVVLPEILKKQKETLKYPGY